MNLKITIQKIFIILGSIIILTLPCLATYTIIDEKEEQQKYNQFVEKITPEMCGIKPTTTNAEYATELIENDSNYDSKANTKMETNNNVEQSNVELITEIFSAVAIFLGVGLFILLLVSPIIILYYLGSHPNWQENFKKNIKKYRKTLIIVIMAISGFFFLDMFIDAYRHQAFSTLLSAIFETFIKYFVFILLITFVTFAYKQFLKNNKKINYIFFVKNFFQMSKYKIFAVITTLFLLITAFADLHVSYAYYQILRWVVFVYFGLTAYKFVGENQNIFIIACIIAILFNPIIPIYMGKESWRVIDGVIGFLLLLNLKSLK